MSFIPGGKVSNFLEHQRGHFENELQEGATSLKEILAFVNFGSIPVRPTWSNGFKISSDADFFKPPAKRVFRVLVGEFLSLGLDQKDLTAWRRLKQSAQPVPVNNPNGVPVAGVELQDQGGVRGFLSKAASVPGQALGLFSPAPFEETEPVEIEEPFETVLDVYQSGLTMVENFGEGMATHYRDEIGNLVNKHLTKLMRKMRTYANEHFMEIGDQMAAFGH